ncbi:MAG: CDP-alcohol phosphatidyltransferase family protein [Pirellulaceae bacterium]|nr:CDP-alcohol phosphatidyltransferase family protein [Pirellulaceae bacterium]
MTHPNEVLNSDDAGEGPQPISGSRGRWLTIPNALCLVRFVGSWVMLGFAFAGQPIWVVGLFLFLTATDWLDGKLAVLLNQRSPIGPRIDTIADVTMYACLLASLLWLRSDVLMGEVPFLAVAIFSYLASTGYAFHKFGSLPSYHTYGAKLCWLLTLLAVIALSLDWSVWPLRIAMTGVVITNIEAMLITATLSRPATDVSSLRSAKRLQQAASQSAGG